MTIDKLKVEFKKNKMKNWKYIPDNNNKVTNESNYSIEWPANCRYAVK